MPSQRLLLALLASLSIHLALLGGGAWFSLHRQRLDHAMVPTPAMIDATLRMPPPAAEPVVKDTLADASWPASTEAPPATLSAGTAPQESVVAARHKLTEHVYYPADAIAAGLEGDVRLLLTLGANGTVIDASVATSSGHAILDQAALRAAYSVGRLSDIEQRQIILPVLFRLRP